MTNLIPIPMRVWSVSKPAPPPMRVWSVSKPASEVVKEKPALCGIRRAGFLFASYIRNTTPLILISYIFLLLIALALTQQADALETQSNYFFIDIFTSLNGGGPVSSTNNNADWTAIGENIVSLEESLSAKFRLLAGQLYLILPPEPWERRKVISDLMARTEILGPFIREAFWQQDNDPYFYWQIDIEPESLLTGFSVSLDVSPDDTIDTPLDYYQFPEDDIASGKHFFYVLPFVIGDVADRDSLLKFEIWVDAEPPLVNQLKPLPASLVADEQVTISANLSDAHSGLDLSSTTLFLNEERVNFTYDAGLEVFQTRIGGGAGLEEGKNTVILKAYDAVGNYVVKAWDFIVDTQAPTGGIKINNGEDVTHSAYVLLNILGEDAVSGIKNVYLSNDGIFDTEMNEPEPYNPIIYNWLLSQPDADGRKTVHAKFEDFAGNISPTYQARISLKLLTPDTRIISGPASVTEKTEAHFKYESTKSGALFSYKLDAQNYSNWSGSLEAGFSGLTEGNHYFSVKSGFDLNADGKITIDEEDATPAQWVWTISPQGILEKLRGRILFWRR